MNVFVGSRFRNVACVSWLLLAVLLGGQSMATVRHALPQLLWPAPRLVHPITVHLSRGSDHVFLNPARDYVLRLPAGGMLGCLWIEGGHNVVVKGGTITVPSTANQTDNGRDNTDTAIYIKNSTGTVHLEGLLLRAQPDVMYDGIDINAPAATVDIEDVRIARVYGSFTSTHADAVQTWGGVGRLRIDGMTIDGDYQGINVAPDLGPVGPVVLRNIDVHLDAPPVALAASSTGGGHMFWFTRGSGSCASPRISLENVYLAGPGVSSFTLGQRGVWPQASSTDLPCRALLSRQRITWPNLRVQGAVEIGHPASGAFVPAAAVGDTYSG